jgi:biotin carboxyl carrier protein
MVKMKFVGSIDGVEQKISVDDHDKDDGDYTLELNGEEFQLDAKTMPSEIIAAIINNKSYDLDVDAREQSEDPLDGRVTIRVRGRVVRLEMLEERRKKMKDAQLSHFAQTGTVQINSPMPGKVLRILVAEGDEVDEGQGLVIIEAMKMENELQAPKAGVIKKIAAEEGAAVDGGALLLVIE